MELNVDDFKRLNHFTDLDKKLKKDGFCFRECQNSDFEQLMHNFDRFTMSRQSLEDVKAHNKLEFIHLAFLQNEIIGFVSYGADSIGMPDITFGPIEIDKKMRGQGIGTVLLAKSLQNVIKKLSLRKVVLTTSPSRVRFYEQVGFKAIHRYVELKKDVGAQEIKR